MSIIGNAYKLSNCPSTISHHDSCVYDCGRIDASSPYLLCRDILASVSAEFGGGDSLEECHNRDALFGFVIRSHLDQVARRGRLSSDNILNRIHWEQIPVFRPSTVRNMDFSDFSNL